MIPEIELKLLRGTVEDAWGLAAEGSVRAGYDMLDAGIAWAEACPVDPATGVPGAPDPWQAELTDRYRLALVEFAQHFRVCHPDPAVQYRQDLRSQVAALLELSAALRAQSTDLRSRGAVARSLGRQCCRRR